MDVAPYLAPSLAVLRGEVDSRWPKRSRKSDGWIGDPAHAARKSEHNPNRAPRDDVPDGAVTALDITARGVGVQEVLSALRGDPRVWYVIYDKKMWSRTYDFKERRYSGSNPHTTHIHVSLMQTKAAVGSRGPWGLLRPREEKLPTLSQGSVHPLVSVIGRFLGVAVSDDRFDAALDVRVKRYQAAQHLRVDGFVGPQTWTRILTALDLDGWRV